MEISIYYSARSALLLQLLGIHNAYDKSLSYYFLRQECDNFSNKPNYQTLDSQYSEEELPPVYLAACTANSLLKTYKSLTRDKKIHERKRNLTQDSWQCYN